MVSNIAQWRRVETKESGKGKGRWVRDGGEGLGMKRIVKGQGYTRDEGLKTGENLEKPRIEEELERLRKWGSHSEGKQGSDN